MARDWRSRRRRPYLLGALVAALGAATVVLPALASGEAPTITATTYGSGLYETQYWSPSSATIEPGGAVVFKNPSMSIAHGLEFTGGPSTPSCTGLPAGALQKTGAVNWQATCNFSAPGSYSFICTVHPKTMQGTVTVSAAGTTTVTTTTTPTTGTATGTTPPPYGTPGGGSTGSGSGSGGAGSGGAGSGLAALLVAGSGVQLSAPRHGAAVHGSLALVPAAAGATLEVDLLAPRASLAAGAASRVRVGRLLRHHLAAGPQSFTVSLGPLGRQALRRHGHLALTVRVVLSLPGGRPLAITRALTLRR